MKLEDQVCSLELAMRLKELRVKQESYVYWCPVGNKEHVWLLRTSQWDESYSAFTVAELGEMLPSGIAHPENNMPLAIRMKHFGDAKRHWIQYRRARKDDANSDFPLSAIVENTEADARAKMMIYLIENKLVSAASIIGR